MSAPAWWVEWRERDGMLCRRLCDRAVDADTERDYLARVLGFDGVRVFAVESSREKEG